jgi:flagellar biosynthesis protein FlhF
MKIRRYKGHSLEKLYETIQSELGPEAVVVSTTRPRGAGALLAPFLGGEPYEVVAVVDDAASEKHFMADTARGEDLKRFTQFQARKWEEMEATVQELRSDIGQMTKNMGTARARLAEGIPEYAADWDPEFLRAVMSRGANVFDPDKTNLCRDAVKSCLRVEDSFPLKKQGKPHIIVLVGPTGSGKTTTLAKLAARWSLDQKLKIGLITTDTFRIAAVDQIKEYSTLLGLELRIAFSANEAAKAAQSFADKDVILVDTPGRNHFDQAGLIGLRGLLQGMGEVTVLMTLPATADRRNVADIMSAFELLRCNYLVVTKIDETRHFDLLTAAATCTTCPVAFMTDGQRVPQDLHAAKMSELVDMLVPKEQK